MRNIKYTTEEYQRQLQPKQIEVIEEYQNSHTKLLHKCLICNHIWSVRPGFLRSNLNRGCPSCYQLSVRKPLSVLRSELNDKGWCILNEDSYQNNYSYIIVRHDGCGHDIEATPDQLLNKDRRCQYCFPPKERKTWATPSNSGHRSYSSKLEMECAEYLIEHFGIDDIILQMKYSPKSRKTADVYVKSKDLYVEISSIQKEWYLERIWQKRKLVKNFIFVSSLNQLQQFIKPTD